MTVKIAADLPAYFGTTYKGDYFSDEGVSSIPCIGGEVKITLESGGVLRAYYSEELTPDATFSEYEERAICWAQKLVNEIQQGA